MNKRYTHLLIFIILAFTTTCTTKKEEWRSLLTKDMQGWENYLSFRHQLGYNGEAPKDSAGNAIQPIGYNKDTLNIFSTTEEHGETVLRISGEIYGCIFTKEEFENYHLKLKFKWGNLKSDPRKDEYMDSGVLYHSQGESGVDYWRSWMLSQEFQIIEKGNGDFWPISTSIVDISVADTTADTLQYKAGGIPTSFGHGTGGRIHCLRGKNTEKPNGEWNTLELICFGDKAIYIINDEVVNAISNSRYFDGTTAKPLTKGKLQLQSEAAEIFFKEIQIKNITKIPEDYTNVF
ncbi:3-keto-disaccharide hydrolase [Pseudochryseolinea flava]|uniref:DUF1080 domain-containing protein n=1 Tax=Pseudochryseolinea flava TaxID=2059302 RepID=A0A364XXI1_9BACT|nr:DUF1080 domain-containing protein [Pseudochryseolinea flava]RAV99007.1 DUF1080 domain-containing protein [Pseudochryseolinea flava]